MGQKVMPLKKGNFWHTNNVVGVKALFKFSLTDTPRFVVHFSTHTSV